MRIGQFGQTLFDHVGFQPVLLRPFINRRVKAQHFVHASLQRRQIPLLGIGSRRAGIADERVDRVVTHVDHHFVDRFGIHDVRALLIDDLALVVHHVIVFNDLFADVVIARFDLLLRGLDGLGHPFGRRQRLAIFQVGTHHLRKQRVRPENSQQIVVEAQVEPRQPGITLPA